MFCWNCGYKNADDNKFCGECGKTLLVPDVPPLRHSATSGPTNTARTDLLKSNHENPRPDSPEPDLQKTEAGMRPAENSAAPRATAKLTNPLVEEPRVVRERLSAVQTAEEPRPIPEASPLQTFARDFGDAPVRFTEHRTRAATPNAAAIDANRITGPSFLGLSDEPRVAEDSSYLLDEEEGSSSWRGYLALAFLLIIGVLVLRQWSEMRGIASEFAQRMGIGDAPKRVKAQPTVSASSDQPGQNPAGTTSTAGESANPASSPNANATTPTQEVAKAKPADSLAGGKPENDANSRDKSESAKSESTKDAAAKGKVKDETAGDDDASTTESAKGAAKPSTKATAAAASTYDNSQVDLAQRYLQGKGVPQDCSRGVSLLRSAARQANPKARIQMAALYMSGHCVEQNLPQAYSWFAQAKELEPNNAWLERNLNSLWSKMTDEERRRVLR
ncbi:MAG: Sel1 [Acidobacteriaceae bacterium]|nr:Sel1 [Acidobacteriaceae bacterium]